MNPEILDAAYAFTLAVALMAALLGLTVICT